jgi:hypothetical protein
LNPLGDTCSRRPAGGRGGPAPPKPTWQPRDVQVALKVVLGVVVELLLVPVDVVAVKLVAVTGVLLVTVVVSVVVLTPVGTGTSNTAR